MSDNQCPDAATWKTFLDGDVPDDAAADLAAHLEDCEVCQQTLERLAAGKETWEGTAKQLADAANAEAGSDSSGHLRGVLDDLKQGIDVGPAATASSRDVLRFLEPSDEPGSIGRLDSYEILEVVGAGGMGVVLRGWDPTLRRVVAIKVLAAHLANSAAAERRFVREAQAAAAVSHDHVVAIHAVEAGHEPPYLVMQFVEGKTLQQRLDRTGPLNVNEILRIGQQTALGLAAAHRQGIVHRDIKPANILLENGVERVRITDFGLARAIDDASMTQSGVVAGTPLFMAPEQAQGQPVDHRSDLFSLGSVLYAMATGRPPFRSSTMMGVIRRVCDDQPRPIREINPDIPDWLCGIIDRLLAKNPKERFQTAEEVAEVLAGCLAHVQHPLSVPLPTAVASIAQTGVLASSPLASTRIEDVDVSAGAGLPSDSPTAAAETLFRRPLSEDDVEANARRLVRWPATWLFLVGVLNCVTVAAVVLYQIAALRNSSRGFVDQAMLIALLPAGVCMIGALRLGSLRSRTWAYISAVTAMISGPLSILGIPIGIWTLTRLGRPDVVAGFAHRAQSQAGATHAGEAQSCETQPHAGSPTFGLHLARFFIVAALWLLAIAIPLGSYVLAQDSGAFPDVGPAERMMLGIVALGVVFGLVFILKRLNGQGSAPEANASRSSLTQQFRRVPEVLACVLFAVFTMQAIYADLTASHYDRFMEAAVVPLFCVTVVVLGIVAFVNRRRINELAARGEDDLELTNAYRTAIAVPLGLMVPVVVLLAVWGYRQTTVGYVTFDVENSMSTVSFRNVETDQTRSLSASWKRVRLPAGTYEWSVSEGPIQNMVIADGVIEVLPRAGQTLSAGMDAAEALRQLVGTWKYVSGSVNWNSSDGPAPTWAQPPAMLSINMSETPGRRVAVFVSQETLSSGNANDVTAYACEFGAETSPRNVSLLQPDPELDPEDWPCVAQGYWQIGQNGLFLILGPAGELHLPNIYSFPTGPHVRYQFNRVAEEKSSTGQRLAAEVELHGDGGAEQLAEIQQLLGFEARVVQVERDADGGEALVEISAGADDGLKKNDSLKVVRDEGGDKPQVIGAIQLRLVEADRAVGVLKQEADGEAVRNGDLVQFVSRVAD